MGCNGINELPDSLLTEILSYLPTKTSVSTSVLSTRWKNLWLRVAGLDLRVDYSDEVLPELNIKYDEFNTYSYRFPEWISTFVDRGIQHLDVKCLKNRPSFPEFTPQNIYKSCTLVSLKLVKVGIEIHESVVSLPCLKILHLEDNCYDDDNLSMGKLISGSPVLEDLTLISTFDREVLLVLCVRSETLKRFRFWFKNSIDGSVEIDAPGLKYMTFRDFGHNKILVKNLSSLLMIDTDTTFSVEYVCIPAYLDEVDVIRDFVNGISSVRRMIISRYTLEVLYLYSELTPIPNFINLFRLEAVSLIMCSMLNSLLIFLESCPNLKELNLDFVVWLPPEQVEFSYVPQCFLSTLECVEINNLIMMEERCIKLVNYFLENAAVLKKLSVSFQDSPVTSEELDAYKNLLTSTKRSCNCQVVFVH